MTTVAVDSTGIDIDNVGDTITITADIGGVIVNTSNVFDVNAGAEASITTTTGNVVLDAAGNVVANSSSGGAGGIAIADNAVAQTVNLGTGAASKTVNIGNLTGTTSVGLTAGTGNITLSGNGTTAGAITIAATAAGGGIDMDAGTGGARLDSTGQIVLSSTRNLGNDVMLEAPNGSLSLSSGAFGMLFSTTGTMFSRHSIFSTHVETQPAHVVLADADATLTTAQLLSKILTGTPTTVPRTLTLPTAASAISGLGGVGVNDSIQFSIINTGSTNFVVATNTGVTLVGSGTVANGTSAQFKMAYRNTAESSEAVTVYRLA